MSPAAFDPRAALSRARLYGILDLGYVAAVDALAMGDRLLRAGVQVLQLRAKRAAESEIVSLGRQLAPLCQAAGVPFILNDYPHLVAEVKADGVHIGQDDGLIRAAREAAGKGRIVGRSTHSVEQARAAGEEGADYIGFGPLFATPTKPEYTPIGLGHIAEVERASPVPVFCIGGVKRENLPQILAAGGRRVVIVTGLLHSDDPARYAADCLNSLNAS